MKVSNLLVVGLATLSLGAKDKGCAVEVQPGDGSSDSWDLGRIPEKTGPDLPMSCAWLEGDNCWKQVAEEALACLDDRDGTFDEERDECSFKGGSRLELAGPISKPASNITLLPVVDHRLVDADGKPCHTSKVLGTGRTAHANAAGVVVFESLSLTAYRVTCPNGKSYSNEVEGSCDSFGLRWLAHETPGYSLFCDGSTDSCEATLWNATAEGPESLFTCKDP